MYVPIIVSNVWFIWQFDPISSWSITGPYASYWSHSRGIVFGLVSQQWPLTIFVTCPALVLGVQTMAVDSISLIARFMEPTWGPLGSCWPQAGPICRPPEPCYMCCDVPCSAACCTNNGPLHYLWHAAGEYLLSTPNRRLFARVVRSTGVATTITLTS